MECELDSKIDIVKNEIQIPDAAQGRDVHFGLLSVCDEEGKACKNDSAPLSIKNKNFGWLKQITYQGQGLPGM